MEENNVMANNKNNLIIKIAIIIGVVLILFGVCFIIFGKKDNAVKDPKTNTKTNEETIMETYPYLIVATAKYGATEEYKEFIDNLFGENAEAKFRVYFQWYNVVHELTHGLITYNIDKTYLDRNMAYQQEGYIEEEKVNDFAIAFLKKYGDQDKIQLLKEAIDSVLSKMKDPSNGTQTIEEYAKSLWLNSDPTFEEYGWFQFNIVKNALEKDLTLEEAFNNLGINKKVAFDEEKISYATVSEETSDELIKDVVKKFRTWGLNYPEVYHVFDDDPNTNYSNSLTKAQYEFYKNQ